MAHHIEEPHHYKVDTFQAATLDILKVGTEEDIGLAETAASKDYIQVGTISNYFPYLKMINLC